MRLAQLARKFDIPKKDILDFLSSKGVSIESHGNTKVDEEHIKLVEQKYGNRLPKEGVIEGQVDTKKEKKNEREDTSISSSKAPVVEEEPKETPIDEEESPADSKEFTEENTQEKPIEVIRPKKVKLQGIKVVGKIDLPEPPKKQEEKDSTEPVSEEKIAPKKQTHKKINRKPKDRKTKKPRRELSYEEKQKREERDRLRAERKKKKELKEKKRKYYEKKVKAQKPSVSKKIKKKEKEMPAKKRQKQVVKHKNPLKRFWAWLNGEYDQF